MLRGAEIGICHLNFRWYSKVVESEYFVIVAPSMCSANLTTRGLEFDSGRVSPIWVMIVFEERISVVVFQVISHLSKIMSHIDIQNNQNVGYGTFNYYEIYTAIAPFCFIFLVRL